LANDKNSFTFFQAIKMISLPGISAIQFDIIFFPAWKWRVLISRLK